eukprot:1144860-Pelagomonas_calceolata.AAC.4
MGSIDGLAGSGILAKLLAWYRSGPASGIKMQVVLMKASQSPASILVPEKGAKLQWFKVAHTSWDPVV